MEQPKDGSQQFETWTGNSKGKFQTGDKVGGLFACGGESAGKENGAPGGEGLGRSLAVGSRLRLAVAVLQSQ